ncbi:MAG TPA: prolyl oligopeptidase family serine peptidase [Thermoanaerobaculia bacterium]|nr:prolyl oligopeptidase family serine peptidase [Thermoanaerobaculia bacterium]
MRKSIVVIALLLLAAISYPVAEKRPVVEKYGDVTFTDNYQWLENANDAGVKTWVAAENKLTRSILDAVPQRAAIGGQLTKLLAAPRVGYFGVTQRAGKIFAMKSAPPKQQSLLVVFGSVDDPKSERVIYDPNAADPSGATEIDFYVPSVDAKRVAISLSQHGSEAGIVHVFDVATGKEQGDVVPRVQFATAGGSVAWNADGTGFWRTRYPDPGERPEADANFYQQIWFHKLGTAASSDTYALGKDFPRIAEIELDTSNDGRYVLANVKNGDGGQAAQYVRQPEGTWAQATTFEDGVRDAAFGARGELYLLSHLRAPNGQILRVAADDPRIANAKVVIPESKTSIDTFVAGRSEIYVAVIEGGPSELLMFGPRGGFLRKLPIPPISSVDNLVRIGENGLLFRDSTYTRPSQWLTFTPRKGVTDAALRDTSPADLGDAEVVREMATSKDGTKVPVNIIYRKGTKLDGNNPTLLVGYGGYSISIRPGMSLTDRVWLDAGGVVAIANVRGGGEYGEAWHEAGKMLEKQNVFDDFAAVAQHLIERKYTTPAKLAIEGASNGGLLMGVELTQHPELFKAVVSHVGLYDLPRWLNTPNGVFNQTEFGSPDNPQQLAAMMAYSPYHHVLDGAKYPAALFMTGDNDFRVDPMNSRKFVARLQAANGSDNPILLRTTSGAGHGIGSALSETIASQTDVFSFLWMELGMK